MVGLLIIFTASSSFSLLWKLSSCDVTFPPPPPSFPLPLSPFSALSLLLQSVLPSFTRVRLEVELASFERSRASTISRLQHLATAAREKIIIEKVSPFKNKYKHYDFFVFFCLKITHSTFFHLAFIIAPIFFVLPFRGIRVHLLFGVFFELAKVKILFTIIIIIWLHS